MILLLKTFRSYYVLGAARCLRGSAEIETIVCAIALTHFDYIVDVVSLSNSVVFHQTSVLSNN